MAQAYLDIKNSEIIYGNVMQADKKGTKAILYEYAHKFYQRAMKSEDLKAQAKALELMAEFGGIRDIEQADYNPEKFENKEITINLSAASVFFKVNQSLSVLSCHSRNRNNYKSAE